MSTDRNDLTSSEQWDRVWTAGHGGGALSRIRGRMRWRREFDLMLGRLLDVYGDPDCDVLEIGCAPGTILDKVHRLRPRLRLHGLDNSPVGVQQARAHFAAEGIEVQIHEGDARELALAPSFSVVLSCGLIEHFNDPTDILRCHSKFARPGGIVAVTVPNYAHPVVRRLLQVFSPETIETHNLSIMNPETLRLLLSSIGLVDVASGTSGGPTLPNSRPRSGLLGRAYRLSARTWNLGTSFVPGSERLWRSHVWAHGRVPAADD